MADKHPKKDPIDALEALRPDGPSDMVLDRLERQELQADAPEVDGKYPPEAMKARALDRLTDRQAFEAKISRKAFIDGIENRLDPAPQAKPSPDPTLGDFIRRLITPSPLKLAAAFLTGALLAVKIPQLMEQNRPLEPAVGPPSIDAPLALQGQNRPKGDRPLGQPVMEIYRRVDQGVEKMESGATAHPGDTIQFALRPQGYPYGLILNLDDQGAITPYYPDTLSPSIALDDDDLMLLPDAIEMDDFLGQEIVIALFSTTPITIPQAGQRVKAWMQSVNNTKPLPLDKLSLLPFDESGDVVEYTFLIRKE